MKKLMLLVIITLSGLLFSAQFEIVKDVTELQGDITAAKYGHKDVNGDWCAILKVHTDIKDLQFEGFGYEKHDYLTESGIYLVYMQPESKSIRFMKNEFIAKNYTFPFKLKSNTVYMMEVKGVGEEKKIEDIAITIQTNPPDATLVIDGKENKKNEKIITGIGKHIITITRSGYQNMTQEIEVTAKETFFSYELKKVKQAEVVINSVPEGVAVYIDGMKIGVTPIPTFYPEGEYTIRLQSDNFEEIEDKIQIKAPKTEKTYQLTDIRATLTVNTHEKAKVFINGQQVADFGNIKLAPQPYTVRVEMSKAKPLEEKFVLQKKEVKILEMHPDIKTGTVQIAVIPADADVELWEENCSKYTGSGSKIFTDVPTGDYNLKVSKNGYKSYTENFKLKADEQTNKSVKLEEEKKPADNKGSALPQRRR